MVIRNMYYALNYFPLMLQVLIFIIPINFNKHLALYVFMNLFMIPIYLLIVNQWYFRKEILLYSKSILFMISVIIINILMFMIVHKIKYGTFIGDVPEGIYYIMVFVPVAIILIGTLILYFVNKH